MSQPNLPFQIIQHILRFSVPYFLIPFFFLMVPAVRLDLPPFLLMGASLPEEGRPAGGEQRLGAIRDNSERNAILVALRENRWNVSRTAQALGISRANIYEKMRRFGIRRHAE